MKNGKKQLTLLLILLRIYGCVPRNSHEWKGKITKKKTRHTSTTHSLMLYILQWIMQNGTHLLKIRKEFFSRSFSLESVRLRHITSLLVIFNRPTKLESDCDSKFFLWFRMPVVMNGSLKNEGKKYDLSSMSKWLGSTNEDTDIETNRKIREREIKKERRKKANAHQNR